MDVGETGHRSDAHDDDFTTDQGTRATQPEKDSECSTAITDTPQVIPHPDTTKLVDTPSNNPEPSAAPDSVKLSEDAVKSPNEPQTSNSSTMDSDAPIAGAHSSAELLDPMSAEIDRVIQMAEDQKMIDQTDPEKNIYFLKRISFHDKVIPIVTQNLNGPCPLLAIINILLLTRRIKFDINAETITNRQLMSLLGELVLSSQPKDLAQGEQANYEQIVSDAINVFHKLQTGLDVNVRFSGVSDFEFTSEMSVFDLLRVRLYHGWLVDPESQEFSILASLTYNQMVMSLCEWREKDHAKAMIAEEFLNTSCSQLTYYGLSQLYSTLNNGNLAVLFRNNHFSTVYRFNDKLYILVTDQGYLRESRVVWETLENIEGDGILVNSEFRPLSGKPASLPLVQIGSDEQVEQDMMLAMTLQQQEEIVNQTELSDTNVQPTTAHAQETDEQFAHRLQMEEQAALQQDKTYPHTQLGPGSQYQGNRNPVQKTDNRYTAQNTDNRYTAQNTDNRYPVRNADPEIGPRPKDKSCTIL